MTTLPLARPSSTHLSASTTWLSGKRRSMTGLTLPTAMSCVTVATSAALNGYHQIIRPIHLSETIEISGPTRRPPMIFAELPPSVT